jgi:hypothetical protein
VASKISIETETQLAEFLAGFYADPYGFVMAVFPWGSRLDANGNKVRIPGMEYLPDGAPNPLIDKTGPEDWQREELQALGRHIRENMERRELGLDMEVWRSAIASGHGVGKSAFVAWVIYFLMSTRVDTRGAVTASTQFQLEDKTWPELAKWHNLALNRHWFAWAGTSFSFAAYPEEKRKNYRATAATVSETNTEAFAGLHNEGRTVFVIFDEASGVLSKIWEVAEGALTDGEGFFFAYGNPTKPDGEFADCFDKHSHIYRTRHVDSRSVSHTNKAALAGIIAKYGEDSDEVKVRIKGQFPTQSFDGFFDVASVSECMQREDVVVDRSAALIMAVDVANSGGDEIVIGFRQGWDARSRPLQARTNLRHGEMVKWVAATADANQPDAIVIECVGIGIPLCDDLEDLGYKVHRAYPGSITTDPHYYNNRALWYSEFRDWVYEPLSAMPDDPVTFSQMTKMKYFLRKSDGKTLMESKQDMRTRGLPSPDRSDMYMLTFAVKVARRNLNMAANAGARRRRMAKTEYDPLNT